MPRRFPWGETLTATRPAPCRCGHQLDRQRAPWRSSAGKHMPRPAVLPSQPRGRAVERRDDEIVKAETDRGRWAVRAEGLKVRGLDNRAALGLVQIAEARLARLHRSRAVLLEGDAGSDDPEPEAE